LLGRPRRLERSLRHEQRVIAILHDVKRRWRAHTLAHTLQKVERAERVARSLQEQDRRLKLQQDLVTKLRSVAGAAKRVAKTDQGLDRLDESEMAADAATHAFSSGHNGPAVI